MQRERLCIYIIALDVSVLVMDPLTSLIEPNGVKMKLGEAGEKPFDVVPVLASVSCTTYFMCTASRAFADQENHLVPV